MRTSDPPWIHYKPELRFEFSNPFLQVESSSVKLTHGKKKIVRASSASAIPQQKHSILPKPLSAQRSSITHDCATAIAHAERLHKIKQRSDTHQKLQLLKETSKTIKYHVDGNKQEKRSTQKLLTNIRSQCWTRLTETRNPLRGMIMRALNEEFVTSLLDRYQERSLTVDMVLSILGAPIDAKRAQTPLDGSSEFMDDVTDITPAISPHHGRIMSPIKLLPGIGFRQSPPKLTTAEVDLKVKSDMERYLKSIPPPNTIIENTYTTKHTEVSDTGNNMLNQRRTYLNFTGSNFDDSPFMVPLQPYVAPIRPSTKAKDVVDDSSMGLSAPSLDRLRAERSIYLDSLDTNSASMIVMQEKYSHHTNRIEWSLHRKQDLRGLWRPKTSDSKTFIRPFVSTT